MAPKVLMLLSMVIVLGSCTVNSDGVKNSKELYSIPDGTESRWISFENPTGEKGVGGMENKGAKGHPFDRINAGESKVLLDISGSGIIRRMWFTIQDQEPEMLRSLKLEMFWDNADKPAVSVPFGDFFGIGLGRHLPFETEFFSNPEGRSFNCSVPMPFKTAAKIVLTNESGKDLRMIFYDINYTIDENNDKDALYFHSYWSREIKTTAGVDFVILPKVEGKGRYLGCNIGVVTSRDYGKSWWGEGEVKMYLDGDDKYPTLIGTGTEDYIGTAWGQGVFNHRYQGCLIADTSRNEWAFYRYHVKDPVYFYSDFMTSIQQIGGFPKEEVITYIKAGSELIPVTIQSERDTGNFMIHLRDFDPAKSLEDEDLIDGWTNYYREDDVSATAYFYLDKATSNLPGLAEVSHRVAGLQK